MAKNKKDNIEPNKVTPKKRGRPPKKQKDPEILNKEEILELTTKWKNGELHAFKSGTVVKDIETNKLGVIQTFKPHLYKYYSIKWHIGVPHQWTHVHGTVHEDDIKKSSEKNPIDIPLWEKYPGPSSEQILKLNESLSKQKNNETLDIDVILESYEDSKKRSQNFSNSDADEDEIDSVVDTTLEPDDEFNSDELYDFIKRKLEDR